MTSPRLPLTDALLKETLTRRAAGVHTSTDLVGDVLAAVEDLPQGRGWSWELARPRRALSIVLVSALVSALAAYSIVAGRPVRAPVEAAGEIAFVSANYRWSEAEGLTARDHRVFTVSSRGGDPTLLVEVPGAERQPSIMWIDPIEVARVGPRLFWSPDGTRIAFRVYHDAPGIYLLNRDGSGLTRLADVPRVNDWPWPDEELAWSPDSTQIAYTHPVGHLPASEVTLVDTEDGHRTRLATGAVYRWTAHHSFAWSPDGSKVAFVNSDNISTTGLYVVNRDGTGNRRLREADLLGQGPGALAWSPDGSRIAFVRGDFVAQTSTMFVINADGTGLRELAGPHAWPANGVAWSPDGRLIAWTRGEGPEIALVNVDGSGERVLTRGDYFDWSPDGSQLVLTDAGRSITGPSNTIETPAIYLINADGTGRRWLADGEYPAWSPVTAPSE